MSEPVYNVLFLCTGNSARSILAESILNKEGRGRFRAYSAGSYPKGKVHPLAIETLRAMDYPTEGFSSKSWDVFAAPGAPHMDFIFTVCDNAAGEACPVWPGHPVTSHWGVEDPAAVEGSQIEMGQAFSQAARYMKNRIAAFVSLPLASIDKLALRNRLREIGAMDGATTLALQPIAGTEPDFLSALAAEGLPTDDLVEDGRNFFRIVRGSEAVGFGGYELHGDDALIRSLVIDAGKRRHGVGEAATRLLLKQVKAAGARRGYLLTSSSEPFFERLGFARIDRSMAPDAILKTRQAANLCPASATLLVRDLQE